MADGPSLDVLTMVLNGGPYLREAIRSVQAQTFADFRFHIVDDGPTDGTPAVLAAAAADDPRIRV